MGRQDYDGGYSSDGTGAAATDSNFSGGGGGDPRGESSYSGGSNFGGGNNNNDDNNDSGGGWVQTSSNTWERVNAPPAPTRQEQSLMDAIAERLSRGGGSENNIIADIIAGNIGGRNNPVARSLGTTAYNSPEAQSYFNQYASSFVDPQGNYNYRNPAEFARRVGENYFGFDKSQSLMQNIGNQLVPGGKTPLGILSVIPGVAGASQGIQNLVSAGNYIAGQAGIGVDNPVEPENLIDKAVATNMSPAQFLQEQFRQDQLNPQPQPSIEVATPPSYQVAGLDDIAGNLFGSLGGSTTYLPDKGLQKKGNTYTSYNPGSNVKQGTSGWDITTVGEALSNIWDAGKSSYRQ